MISRIFLLKLNGECHVTVNLVSRIIFLNMHSLFIRNSAISRFAASCNFSALVLKKSISVLKSGGKWLYQKGDGSVAAYCK